MESEKIIEKLRRYLEEKEGLDYTSCYFITKELTEEYWDDIKNEGEEDDIPEEEDDEFSDFEDDKNEKDEDDSFEDDSEEVVDVPKKIPELKPVKPKKQDNNTLIKKPKIKLI